MLPAEAIAWLQKLPADEPVFVLRAKDKFAPSTVASWAGIVGSVTVKDGPETAARAYAKAYSALQLVAEMDKYQAEHGSKIPD